VVEIESAGDAASGRKRGAESIDPHKVGRTSVRTLMEHDGV
jgi:hypothetical protein